MNNNLKLFNPNHRFTDPFISVRPNGIISFNKSFEYKYLQDITHIAFGYDSEKDKFVILLKDFEPVYAIKLINSGDCRVFSAKQYLRHAGKKIPEKAMRLPLEIDDSSRIWFKYKEQ
jgi:hypothetical protein